MTPGRALDAWEQPLELEKWPLGVVSQRWDGGVVSQVEAQGQMLIVDRISSKQANKYEDHGCGSLGVA